MYFNKLGVAAFALKYRLGGDKAIEGPKPYTTNVHARQDGHRAMRLIRSHAWKVVCLDAVSGKTLWSEEAIKSKPRLGTHRDNTYASETPVTDGRHIVAYFGMTGVFCYDLDGKELWKKDLGNFPMQNEWGTASSPIIHNGLLFLQVDNEKESFLMMDLVRVNKLPEENARYWASSAASDGALFLRSTNTVYAVSAQ